MLLSKTLFPLSYASSHEKLGNGVAPPVARSNSELYLPSGGGSHGAPQETLRSMILQAILHSFSFDLLPRNGSSLDLVTTSINNVQIGLSISTVATTLLLAIPLPYVKPFQLVTFNRTRSTWPSKTNDHNKGSFPSLGAVTKGSRISLLLVDSATVLTESYPCSPSRSHPLQAVEPSGISNNVYSLNPSSSLTRAPCYYIFVLGQISTV
ncbi:hypothetical protein Tco_0960548 [Tanacetum coccineum]